MSTSQLFVGLAAVVLVAMVVSVPVAAQENGTATPTDAGNETTYAIAVDERLRVVDWTLRDGVFHIELESEIPVIITVTDVLGSLGGEGASNLDVRRITLPPGRTEVSVSAQPYRGKRAVTVSSPRGAVVIQEGTGGTLLSPPYSVGDVRMAAVGGGAAGLGAVALIAFRRVSSAFKGVDRLI